MVSVYEISITLSVPEAHLEARGDPFEVGGYPFLDSCHRTGSPIGRFSHSPPVPRTGFDKFAWNLGAS